MKRFIPKRLRLEIKLLLRFCKDVLRSYQFQFAQPSPHEQRFTYKIGLSQPIKQTASSVNKIANLKIASKKMEKVIIYPGELFSFWKIVGAPNKNNGYKKGRNLVAGELKEDYGGGLCQLSGILYHLSLIAGLTIVERYNHTVDIYTDETRYTPLGSDATVVYGYKDLRIRNNFGFPISFQFIISDDALKVDLKSTEAIEKQTINFIKHQHLDKKEVRTIQGENHLIAQSFYISDQ